MPSVIQAESKRIVEIFSEATQYLFSIPNYQRPYSWGEEQVNALFDDLFDAFKNSEEPGKKDEYFLGNIVIINRMGENGAYAGADVVDGQQRLTTLTILLSVMRWAISDIEFIKKITRMIYADGRRGSQGRFRLELRDLDKVFFQENVQDLSGVDALQKNDVFKTDAQKKIKLNTVSLIDKLREKKILYSKNGEDFFDEELCMDFVDFIRDNCFLVVISTENLDSAYRVFSSLNSKGLDLSPVDIFKAKIIGKIDAKSRSKYTVIWENIECDLGREGFEELFSHIRMMHIKRKPKHSLLKDFELEFGADETAVAAKDFIDEKLIPLAGFYRSFLDAKSLVEGDFKQKLTSSLFWLERLEFSDWVPPALAFVFKFKAASDIQSFFKRLECLAYFLSVTRASVNVRIERFSNLTASIEQSKDFKSLVSAKSPLVLSKTEKQIFYSGLDGPIYESLSVKARLNILLKLDSLTFPERVATYDYKKVSIEHVFPQKPKSLADWPEFTRPDRVYWTHKVANLALLSRSRNAMASNLSFERKKEAYVGSSFALTMELGKVKAWSPETLEVRQRELLSKLEDDWDLKDRAKK